MSTQSMTQACLWRVHILSLCDRDHDWSGVFNSEEEARTALDRSQCFRVRVNAVRCDAIYVLEASEEALRAVE